MGVSYNKLWKMLIDKNMKRIEMQYLTGISGNILARMGKNQYVSKRRQPDILGGASDNGIWCDGNITVYFL